jgi:hypothetical protein
MPDRTVADLERENLYLRNRVAQLQSDVEDIAAENGRLREERERLYGRRVARPSNPLGGGQ